MGASGRWRLTSGVAVRGLVGWELGGLVRARLGLSWLKSGGGRSGGFEVRGRRHRGGRARFDGTDAEFAMVLMDAVISADSRWDLMFRSEGKERGGEHFRRVSSRGH